MLDVCLLGSGGMMPLPYRWLTALMLRYNGSSLLIDCGEGTQIAMKEKGWSFKPIDVICFTHYHGDHISGLPGLLLTMGNADRTGAPDPDRSQRAGAGGERPARHRAGAALSRFDYQEIHGAGGRPLRWTVIV